MTNRLPAAVLWDMDGTLVDTEAYWIQAETDLVEAHGGTWTYEDALTLVGSGLWDAAEILRLKGVDLTADEIVTHLVDRVASRLHHHGVPFRPGAEELLRETVDAGVPTALVTMSIRRLAEQVVSSLSFRGFDVIVSGDEVELPKPDPQAYLRAAENLRVDIHDCVAIEDSITGVASAASSGATTIAVPHAVNVGESPNHTLWPTLAGRTLSDLADVHRTRRTLGAETTADTPRDHDSQEASR